MAVKNVVKRTRKFTKTAEEMMEALSALKTERSARALFDSVYGTSGEDSMSLETKDAYKAQVEVTWDVFYGILNAENKFHLHDHFCSSYCLINLMRPKIVTMFNSQTKGVTQRADLSDYFQTCLVLISSLMEKSVDEKGKVHGYDAEKNTNILPFTENNLKTALNDVLKPEIPKYIANKYHLSTTSLDGLLDSEESSYEAPDVPTEMLEEIDDTKNELYAPSFRSMTVEDYCIAKIMSDTTGKTISEVIRSTEFSDLHKVKTAYTDGRLGLSDTDIQNMRDLAAEEESEMEGEKEAV